MAPNDCLLIIIIIFQVLHPGNCKQSVPPALAIFNETTIDTFISYFPEREDAAGFLKAVNCWVAISNSKKRFSSYNKLGNAITIGDNKTVFS